MLRSHEKFMAGNTNRSKASETALASGSNKAETEEGTAFLKDEDVKPHQDE